MSYNNTFPVALCKGFIDDAVKMGLVVRNVAKVVEPPRMARVTMQTLSPEEVSRFLGVARDTDYYIYFATFLYTGLRCGELIALRWRNLDLGSGKLSVVETAYRLGNGEYRIKEPKTPQSRRLVSMTPKLATFLRDYRQERKVLYHELGKELSPDDLLFANVEGKPLDPGVLTHNFARIAKRSNLQNVRFHDLRHTFASLMLLRGAKPKVISEALGHSSVAFTMDVYSHIIEGMQSDAMALLDEVLPVGKNGVREKINVNLTSTPSIMLSKN